MSGLEWLALGAGPLLLIGITANYVLRRFRSHRQSQLDRIEQLGDRLNEQLAVQSSKSELALSSDISQKILQRLRDSQRRVDAAEDLGHSSIDPVQDSVVIISQRLTNFDTQLASDNDLTTLSLAALAVIYIHSHIGEMIRVEEMAKELCVSRIKLNSYLNQTLGCSAQVLINVIKMQEAKKLLKTGGLLIKEVAIRVGYLNPYHFSVRFKLFFGMAPSVFQNHYQKRNQHKPDISQFLDGGQAEGQPSPPIEAVTGVAENNKNPVGDDATDLEVLAEGTKVDRFLIVSLIGRGGMGVVYKAYDPKLNRGVALKLIRADQAQSDHSKNRLLREAQALARLSHPNVLHVYDVGTFGEQVFMTMALVEGQTLKHWLKDKNRSVDEILHVLIAAGKGLSAAHKAGLVHRDFKPHNVIVGNDAQVRVLDFGLARAMSATDLNQDSDAQSQELLSRQETDEGSSGSVSNLLLTPLTHAGHILGTPLYMAPEQHLGINTDERSDIFSFCVVLYEALYGKRPFYAKTINELRGKLIQQQMRTPPTDTEVPDRLWQIIRKGLLTDPEDRYQSMDLLLEELSNDPLEDRRLEQQLQRRKRFIALVTILTILVPIGVWSGLRYRTAQLCKSIEGEVSGIWDKALKKSAQNAILNTNKAVARETWERVERILDHYLADWTQMRSDVCEARWLRATQSEELFDLRMNCLQKRLGELGALVRVLTSADSRVVEKAVQASSDLTNITVCADTEALIAGFEPPHDTSTQKIVEAARKEIARADAFSRTGQFQRGLTAAQSGIQLADNSRYLPVQAEALMCLAKCQENLGNYETAVTDYQDALWSAVQVGYDMVAAQTANHLLRVVGYRLDRQDQIEQLAARSASFIKRIGNPEELLADWHGNLGMALFGKSDWSSSLKHFRKAVAIQKSLYGPTHLKVSASLTRLGAVQRNLGNLKSALEFHQQALTMRRAILGEKHSQVAACHTNIGNVYRDMGEYDLALEHQQQSIAILEVTVGPNHPTLSASIHNAAMAFMNLGQPQQAAKFYSHAAQIRKESLGENHQDFAMSLIGWGSALAAVGDYAQASTHVHTGYEIICEHFGKEHPLVTHPLEAKAEILIMQGDLTSADNTLERALKICQQAFCPPTTIADLTALQYELARQFWDTNRSKKKAITLMNRVISAFGEMGHQKEREARNWLQLHSSQLPTKAQ